VSGEASQSIKDARKLSGGRGTPLDATGNLKQNSITLAGSKQVGDPKRAEIWPII